MVEYDEGENLRDFSPVNQDESKIEFEETELDFLEVEISTINSTFAGAAITRSVIKKSSPDSSTEIIISVSEDNIES